MNIDLEICRHTQSEGFGAVYERIMLKGLLENICQRFKFNNVLEFKSPTTKGYDNLIFLEKSIPVTIFDERADYLAKSWPFDIKPSFTNVLPEEKYDLVWNFAVLQLDSSTISQMKKLSGKYVLVFVPNILNYGTPFHFVYHFLSGTKCQHPERGSLRLRTKNGMEKFIKDSGLKIIKTGYIDMPWWPDTAFSIKEFKKNVLRMNSAAAEFSPRDPQKIFKKIHQMSFVEKKKIFKPIRNFFAHHFWVLAYAEIH